MISEDRSRQLVERIEQLLTAKVQKFKNEQLTDSTCVGIYCELHEALADVFNSSGVNLTNDAVNYVAQTYYSMVLINNNQPLNHNIFTKRVSVKDIKTSELALIASLFVRSPVSEEAKVEIRRRS